MLVPFDSLKILPDPYSHLNIVIIARIMLSWLIVGLIISMNTWGVICFLL